MYNLAKQNKTTSSEVENNTLSIAGPVRFANFILRKAAEARPIPMGSADLRRVMGSVTENVEVRPNMVKEVNWRGKFG